MNKLWSLEGVCDIRKTRNISNFLLQEREKVKAQQTLL